MRGVLLRGDVWSMGPRPWSQISDLYLTCSCPGECGATIFETAVGAPSAVTSQEAWGQLGAAAWAALAGGSVKRGAAAA